MKIFLLMSILFVLMGCTEKETEKLTEPSEATMKYGVNLGEFPDKKGDDYALEFSWQYDLAEKYGRIFYKANNICGNKFSYILDKATDTSTEEGSLTITEFNKAYELCVSESLANQPIIPEKDRVKLTTIEQIPQHLPQSKPANCQIELAGKSIYDGSCNFESSGGGSFSITGFYINESLIGHVQKISVEVDESKNGIVFGYSDDDSAHEWGQAKRSKGCWIGSNFKVCAYASEIKAKNSSVEQSNKSTREKEFVKQVSKEEELEHVRKVLDEGDAPLEVKAIVYCTRKAEIYHTKKDMQEIEFTNCLNSLNPNY